MSAVHVGYGNVYWRYAIRRDVYPYLVFFVGGMPALIYQVTWQRVLTLYFGVDIYSTSVTVATFLFGLGVGSVLGGWLADRVKTPAWYYAGIEILMGAFGLASLALFSRVGRWLAGSSLGGVILGDFMLLLVPTTLMGMTLPLMCRIVISGSSTLGRQVSWLYSVNTLGAAVGALLSSYFLIGLAGLDGTIRLAALLNIILALAVAVYAVTQKKASDRTPLPTTSDYGEKLSDAPHEHVLGHRAILILSFVSGFIALGYEIVWYRVLGILLHGTVYVFGTILFFYLAGIAFGSLLARKRIDDGRCIERFALCQLGIAAYVFVLFTLLGHFSWLPLLSHLTAASFFTTFHPSLDLVTGRIDLFAVYSLLDICVWAFLIVGVPTTMMGYAFPNLIRAGTPRLGQLGHSIGGIYFTNIIGSTLGSLMIGFVAIHYLGSEHTLQILIVLGSLVPVVLFVTSRHRLFTGPDGAVRWWTRWAYAACALVLLTTFTFPGRAAIIRALHFADHDAVAFVGAEDRSGVSVLREQRQVIAFNQEARLLGERRLYIDGANHGEVPQGSIVEDWAVQVALAAHPAPRRVLCVGLGDGHMAATAVRSPDVDEVVIVELNGTVAPVLRKTLQGQTVLDSEKVTYVVDDGRRWLLAHPEEKFDFIMMWPLHAAHASSGSLYSREFFEIVATHLTEGGIVLLKTSDLYSTAKTIASVFSHVLRVDTVSYIAGVRAFQLDERRLPSSPEDTVKRITADRDVIVAKTRQARINTDLRPNSEYYITYPYASTLRPQVESHEVYRAEGSNRFFTLISKGASESTFERVEAGASSAAHGAQYTPKLGSRP